jgi:RND family efflux transporter MFP subunit
MAREGLVSDLDLETQEAQLAAATAQAAQDGARVEQARATVEERRAALARTVVRSPVPGLVGRREIEVGELVDTSTLLFLVGDFANLVVEVSLTQAMLESVEVGTPVEVETGRGTAETIRAEISRISPFLERSTFSTEAEIDVANREGRLRPGMFVTVNLLHGSTDRATLVPFSALREDPRTGVVHLFVVEDTVGLAEPEAPGTEIPGQPRRVVRRRVDVVAESRGAAGVRGAGNGEWVVTLGQHLLDEAMQATETDRVEARVRPTSWPHVLGLESLQREDLLESFLARQQQMAGVLGAELPGTREEVDEALRAAEGVSTGGR